jgi:hypothetical protein
LPTKNGAALGVVGSWSLVARLCVVLDQERACDAVGVSGSPVSSHEARLALDGTRAQLGAWYTPQDVVSGLLDLALDPVIEAASARGADAIAGVRVLDPACGAGNFLVAAGERIARALHGAGLAPAEARTVAFGRCVVGVDIDVGAAGACRAALSAAGASEPRVIVDDALLMSAERWASLVGGSSPDLVVGNPPFLGRLRTATAPTVSRAAALRERFGAAAASYTDPAALFLCLGAELARPADGRVALVLPTALLASRDAGAARSTVLRSMVLTDAWIAGEPVFDASVDVCAAVLTWCETMRIGRPRVRLHAGRTFVRAGDAAPIGPSDDTWSGLLSAAAGVPERPLATSGTIADIASATADFRDQYYGLADHVVDAIDGDARLPKLVTSGLIDPAHLRWGECSTRFAKSGWGHPRVDVSALKPAIAAWAQGRLVPKVLLATQTRALEAIADPMGELLPSVPVISVVPHDPADVARVGALLASPAATLVASQRHLGSGRNRNALRLRAADVVALPLPADRAAWDRAADAFAAASASSNATERRAQLVASAAAMNQAFGLGTDDDLTAWWSGLLPRR